MAVVVHVDLCTNRSGLDNSTHQSRPHNPFLKNTNQRKTAEWANSTTQDNKKKTTTRDKRQKSKHIHHAYGRQGCQPSAYVTAIRFSVTFMLLLILALSDQT